MEGTLHDELKAGVFRVGGSTQRLTTPSSAGALSPTTSIAGHLQKDFEYLDK